MPEETSREIASLASRYLCYGADDLAIDIGTAFAAGPDGLKEWLTNFTTDVRALAGSALTQVGHGTDEA